MQWVTMVHDETDGTTRIPADAEVIRVHEAKGWRIVEGDDEDAAISVPARVDVDPDEGAWVELVHPDLPAATNRVPNHPDALAGAFEAGWRFPEADPDDVAAELREIRGGKGGRAKAADRELAEERAAAAGAVTDEPPEPITAPATDDDVPAAGDDDKGVSNA
jgi:hypothetical protein